MTPMSESIFYNSLKRGIYGNDGCIKRPDPLSLQVFQIYTLIGFMCRFYCTSVTGECIFVLHR